MRFHAPDRCAIAQEVFARPPLSEWSHYMGWLKGEHWPTVQELNAAWVTSSASNRCFVRQCPELLADGLHYEQRIAKLHKIATRERNWHDLFNALIWLRYPKLKAALNMRQVQEIAQVGDKQRSRAQCALTHFDEGGAIVIVRDPNVLQLWDAHNWHGLFWRERSAWGRDIEVIVFGHALLEHALVVQQTLVAKALVVIDGDRSTAMNSVVSALVNRHILNDPQELRPLPLSGIPGWHSDGGDERFYREAPCFCPLRVGRRYPPPLGSALSGG